MASQSPPKPPSKEAKDLACLVAALQSSRTKLDIDYDEFIKLHAAPTRQAAQMRLYRLGKSLGVELTGPGSRRGGGGGGGGGGGKVTTDIAISNSTGKRKATTAKPKLDADEESDEDELAASPSKKVKSEQTTYSILTSDDESAGPKGDGGGPRREVNLGQDVVRTGR